MLSTEARRDLGLEDGLVELRSVAESKDPVIAVPAEAIVKDAEGRAFVFSKKGGSEEDGVYARTEVELGAGDEEFTEIKSGLFPGDTIVVENADRVPTNADVPDGAKGGDDEKPRGGFVDRSKENRILKSKSDGDVAASKAGGTVVCRLCDENSAPRREYFPPVKLSFPVEPAWHPPVYRSRQPLGRSRIPRSYAPGCGYVRPYCPPAPCPW